MLNPGVKRLSAVRFDLPASHTREIGRIIVAWSFIEHLLQSTIWELAGVEPAIGRLAVREPREQDRLTLINDLARIKGIKIPTEHRKALFKQLKKCAEIRNLLAHGCWVLHPTHGWMVVLSRGSYEFEPANHSKNRRVDPEGKIASAEMLAQLREQFSRVAESVRSLRFFLATQQQPSAEKPPTFPPR